MSRADEVREAVEVAMHRWYAGDVEVDAVLHALVDVLGISWDDFWTCGCGCNQTVLRHEAKPKIVAALSDLLTAAGISRTKGEG